MSSTRSQVNIHIQVAPAFARKVKRAHLREAVRAAFESCGEKRRGELTLVVTDDAQVKELNRTYRGVNATTDVLSFADGACQGEEVDPKTGQVEGFISSPGARMYFGDIVVSYPQAVAQAAQHGHPAEEELWLLVAHGVLHILGYDHERLSDREGMWCMQSAALASLGIRWQP